MLFNQGGPKGVQISKMIHFHESYDSLNLYYLERKLAIGTDNAKITSVGNQIQFSQ